MPELFQNVHNSPRKIGIASNLSNIFAQKTKALSPKHTEISQQMKKGQELMKASIPGSFMKTDQTNTEIYPELFTGCIFYAIGGFLFEIKEPESLPIEFSERLWHNMVDHVKVYEDDRLVFVFRNGLKITEFL